MRKTLKPTKQEYQPPIHEDAKNTYKEKPLTRKMDGCMNKKEDKTVTEGWIEATSGHQKDTQCNEGAMTHRESLDKTRNETGSEENPDCNLEKTVRKDRMKKQT